MLAQWCEVTLGTWQKRILPDGSEVPESSLYGLDGLSVVWGRETIWDQPEASSVTLDVVLGPWPWPAWVSDDLLTVGAPVTVAGAVGTRPAADEFVFVGTITDVVVTWDEGWTTARANVTAVDYSRQAATDVTGDVPFPEEPVPARLERLEGIAHTGMWADAAPGTDLAGVVLARQDVDAQPWADLVSEVATSADAVAWPVHTWDPVSAAFGPGYRIERMSDRPATVTMHLDPDGRTNILGNPSFETDAAGWSVGGGGILTRVTTDHAYGVAAGQLAGPVNASTFTPSVIHTAGVVPGEVWTASASVKGAAGTVARIGINFYAAGAAVQTTYASFTLTGGWDRVHFTSPVPATANGLRLIMRMPGASYLIDGAMLERSDVPGPYIEGSSSLVIVGPALHPAAVFDDLSACWTARAGVEWGRTAGTMVTRVSVTWSEVIDGPEGPEVNERTVTLADSDRESVLGVQGAQIATQLATEAAALDMAADVLARSTVEAWAVTGIELDGLDPATPAEAEAFTACMRMAGREGRPVRVSDMPAWSPAAGGRLVGFIEGGTATFSGGRWLVLVAFSSIGGTGTPARWVDFPATDAWQWQDFAPDVAWLDTAIPVEVA